MIEKVTADRVRAIHRARAAIIAAQTKLATAERLIRTHAPGAADMCSQLMTMMVSCDQAQKDCLQVKRNVELGAS